MRTTVLFMVVAVLAFSPTVGAFEAMPSGHWAAAAVEDLHAEGVLIGYPDGTFRGANPATRYELAVALKRLENVVRGLAANTRVAGVSEGTKDAEAIRAEAANLRTLVDSLAEAVKKDSQNDARQDKALTDLAETVRTLEQTVKADKARVDALEKLVAELKNRVAALDPSSGRLDQLLEENSKLKAEVAGQKASIQRMYWLIAAAAVLGVAVK